MGDSLIGRATVSKTVDRGSIPLLPVFSKFYFFSYTHKFLLLMSFKEKTITFIRLIVPAGEAMPVPPLSATLGQSQINANDFCKQFNFRSSIYEPGTLLSIHIFRHQNGSFFFTINRIFLPFLLYQCVEKDDKTIFVEKLYDIFKIYSRFSSNDNTFSSLCSQFFGAIRASKFTIIL